MDKNTGFPFYTRFFLWQGILSKNHRVKQFFYIVYTNIYTPDSSSAQDPCTFDADDEGSDILNTALRWPASTQINPD